MISLSSYNMRKTQLFLWLICTNVFFLYGIEGLRFENITNKEGLSHNTVRCVMQDSRGFIWISTINGLNLYDGHKFISMHPGFGASSLSENNIRYTIEDNNKRIWVHTTSRFVNCYDIRTESFIDYTGKNENRNYKTISVKPNGDIWLWGTDNGACNIRYIHGEAVSTLYDISSCGTNVISFVLEDTSGRIWMGTNKGLIQIEKEIPSFCNTQNRSYDYHSAVELKNRIYFFTNSNQVIVFDKQGKVFLPVISLPENITIRHTVALDEKYILITGKQTTLILDGSSSKPAHTRTFFNGEELKDTHILTDNKGSNWVYNKSGNVWRYRKDIQKFERFTLIPPAILSVIDSERFDIYCDSRDITWITTFGNGLFAIENTTGQVSHFTTANSGLRTNYLLSVTEDRSKDIWIGTEHTGISKISLTKYNNEVFLPNPDETDHADRIIRSIYEHQENGDLWIGTKSGNVYLFHKNLKQKSKFALRQGVPYCITSDTTGNIWIGTKGNGLLIIPKGKTSLDEAYYHPISNGNSNNRTNLIYSILCDRKGRIWVGTFGDGLFLCELVNGKLHTRVVQGISDKQKQIRCMIQDTSGMIWVGGESGIAVFDPDRLPEEDHHFDWFCFDKDNPQSLNNNIVKAIFEDSRQQIWIGTSGGGLNLAVKDPVTEKFCFNHYTSEEGLINNMVQAILEDDDGNLWVSTESGISKFNADNVVFENYNSLNAWESELFCESSAFKRKNGELLFGSFNGMYIFNPSSFESETAPQPVMITGLSINGIPVAPHSPDSPLKESITLTQRIRLKNGQNSFSIEFSSLNFQSSRSNRYTYILERYDKNWNPVTQYNVAAYKNIPAGKYLFRVKSTNNTYGPDNTESRLEIIIVPPFWKSSKAFALYILLFMIAIFFTTKLIVKMNKLHNEVEVEKQLTAYRLRFFTNISHEFRTPLTIIRGSIESMNNVTPLPPALKKHIRTLEKSSARLMRLIDQLLEFRKMQNNRIDLQLEETDAVGFLRGIVEMFSETAKRKHIDFTFSSGKDLSVILLDKGKIEKIAFNLLSNAFKHTPQGGSIAVELNFDEAEKLLSLKVSDSGTGIPPEKRDLLFVRFKQINYSSSGIGIGLNLTAELVQVHKGEIKYSDSIWGGACFTVSIPTDANAYDPKDIIQESAPLSDYTAVATTEEREVLYENEPEKNAQTKKYTILLIEDDEEILLFLKDRLSDHFTVSTASNGRVGCEAAGNDQPSLIVCDVMMPEMDGFEVTRKIKSDFQTSHIPVILLTAHSSIEHQLEGINAGADAYIIKPFSMKYLISRIIRLIEQRERLQYKFAHEPGVLQTTICTTNKDHEFIKKIHDIIEQYMDDPDFSIDDFAQAACMGRTLFYKKIKGITNYSPNEYLRIVRLKKAAGLLRTTGLNISEVAYKVGFNDPDYFSKCFRDQFGMRPTQFRQGEENSTAGQS